MTVNSITSFNGNKIFWNYQFVRFSSVWILVFGMWICMFQVQIRNKHRAAI